jgi:glycosyltransferase involved in cell wall biosynthesis
VRGVQIQNYSTSEGICGVCKPRERDIVTVVVPTLNEALSIGRVLSEMPREILDEIVVVDSSDDGTAEIAWRFDVRVVREMRRGYGRALQTGIECAMGDVVVYIDGDSTYDPRDIPRVVKPILSGKCDVVLGNRLGGKMYSGAMDLFNRVGNTILSLIFSFVFFRRVNDSQCGLRAMRKRFLVGLSYKDYGMPYVTEQLAKLVKKGARICNVPVTYRPRIGTTKLCKWTDGFKILKVILRERLSK